MNLLIFCLVSSAEEEANRFIHDENILTVLQSSSLVYQDLKSTASVVLVLANFLSVLLLVILSRLSKSPHSHDSFLFPRQLLCLFLS